MDNKDKSETKGCFWGCFAMIMIVLGIAEFIIGIVMFNPIIIGWAVLSTFAFMFMIGGKLKPYYEEDKEVEDKEIIEVSDDTQEQKRERQTWGKGRKL